MTRSRVPLLVSLVIVWLSAAAVPAAADLASRARTTPDSAIGIKLLDAPVSRRADPRAHSYIIDHLAPGTTIERRVEIANDSPTRRHIDLYAAAASIVRGTFVFAPGRTPNELTTWTSFGRTGLTMAAHATATVRTRIRVPRDAPPGEQYGVIWAQAAAARDPAHNVTMVSRVGVRMYIDVGPGGEPPTDFRIERLYATRSRHGRPRIRARVRNTGGRAVDITGTLWLSDGPGGLRAGPFSAQPGTTLAPGDVATATVTLDRRLPDGPWDVRLTLRSGLVTRTVDARIRFPRRGGHRAMAGPLGSGGPPHLLATAVAAFAFAVLCCYLFSRILRHRRRVSIERTH